MMQAMRLWNRIAELLAGSGRLALVTVVETKGSTPREAGAAMIVLPNGAFSGTIGGGALEWQALGAAQAALERGGHGVAFREFALGPELGQCCGGRLNLATEVLDSSDLALARMLAEQETSGPVVTVLSPTPSGLWQRRIATPEEAATLAARPVAWTAGGTLLQRFGEARTQLRLFGAGHVGRALVLALAPLPFHTVWIDPRPAAFPDRIAGSVEALTLADPVAALEAAPTGSFVLVMTHSHALDFDIVAAALAARRFPFVGLIGSATKRARFVKRLRDLDLGEAADQRLICPIGITAIGSKLPAAIAAGIAADLLIRCGQRTAAVTPAQMRANG